MIYPSILSRRYEEYKPFLDETAKRVKDTLFVYCEERGYAFNSRFKTIESLAEKIETGRYRSWSELDDLFACTIIIPTLLDEEEVIQFCERTFNTRTIRKGSTQKSPDIFRFDSTRIWAQLRRPDGFTTPEHITIFDIPFEIQIRSAFEHAWSVSTHALAYKSPTVDWKRLRLAAQLKAIVEQLDTLILGFDQVMINISENPWYEIERKRIIAERVGRLFVEGNIPSELSPKDLSRFCDNLYSLLKNSGKEESIDECLGTIEEEIHNTATDLIPKSISLLQYFFAILVTRGAIRQQPRRYTCHITSELLDLYPALRGININQNFDYLA